MGRTWQLEVEGIECVLGRCPGFAPCRHFYGVCVRTLGGELFHEFDNRTLEGQCCSGGEDEMRAVAWFVRDIRSLCTVPTLDLG